MRSIHVTPWYVTLCALVVSSVIVACAQTTPGTPPPVTPPGSPPVAGSFPILFVTQVPIATDFATVVSTFGNHEANTQNAPRGGDLWIRYNDASLKNLTKAAGFGTEEAGNLLLVIEIADYH